jgi:hypothetical protein
MPRFFIDQLTELDGRSLMMQGHVQYNNNSMLALRIYLITA